MVGNSGKIAKIKKQIEKALRSGKIKNAIEWYKKLLIENPNDYMAMNQLADLLARTENKKEAFNYYEKIAEYYDKSFSYPKAIAIYRKMYRIDPNNLKVALKLAELYRKTGMEIEAKKIYLDIADNLRYQKKTNEVLEVYQKLADLDRDNVDIRLTLANLYEKVEKPDKASNEYIKIAEYYLKNNDIENAEKSLEKAIEIYPKNYVALKKLIDLYRENNKLKDGIDLIKNFLKLYPEDIEIKRILGELYFEAKIFNEAEKIFIEIIDKNNEINEQTIETIKKLVQIRLRDGEYDEAFKIIVPVVDKLVENNEDEKAHELLNLIIADNDSYIPALMKKAYIYKKRDKKANLISVLNAIYEVYKAQKEKDKMIETLEELIKLDPKNFNYRDELVKIKASEVVHEEKDEKGKLSEDELTIINHINQFDKLFNAGLKEEAIRNLEYLKELHPKSEAINNKLLDYYITLQLKTKALQLGKEMIRHYESMEDIESAKRIARKLIEFAPEDPLLNIYISKEETEIEFNPEGELELEGMSFEGEKSPTKEELSKLDFYIEDGYNDSAIEFLNELKNKYPNSKELAKRENLLKEKVKGKIEEEEERESSFFDFEMKSDSHNSNENKPSSTEEEKEEEISQFEELEAEEEFIIEDEISVEGDIEIEEESSTPVFEESNEIESDIIFSDEKDELLFESSEEQIDESSPSSKESSREEGKESIKIEKEAPKKEPSIEPELEDEIFLTEEDVFGELSDEELSGENVFSGDQNYYYELGTIVSQEVSTIKEITNRSKSNVSTTIERSLDEVLSQFKEKINETISEEDYETRFNLGLAYFSMGLIDEAINEFLIASKDEKWRFSSFVHLGMAFLNKGLFDESEKWFKRAIQVKGQSQEDYLGVKYELANLYDIKGEKEKAVELLREILQIDPNFRDVKAKIKQLLY